MSILQRTQEEAIATSFSKLQDAYSSWTSCTDCLTSTTLAVLAEKFAALVDEYSR